MRQFILFAALLFSGAVLAKGIVVESCQPRFTVKVAANPTTGYTWFLSQYNHRLVKPVSMRYLAPKERMPGKGGEEEWTFTAKPEAFTVPQVFKIKLIYARPWEKKPLKEHVFHVFYIFTKKSIIAPDGKTMLCQN